jgi:nucleoid-associated protein YgaU
MGLIQFMKNVGKKLALDTPGQPAGPAAAKAPSTADIAQQQERKRELALANLINQMGFKVKDLAVDIEGSKAMVRGQVDTQEVREKIVLMVGNVEGIDAVDDQLKVLHPEPEAQYYDVKSGDTLSKIAKQFYGNANKYNLIFEANRPMLKNADEIYPGQKLRIPAEAAVHV